MGRPPVDSELAELVRTTALANPLWGAPRNHGEFSPFVEETGTRATFLRPSAPATRLCGSCIMMVICVPDCAVTIGTADRASRGFTLPGSSLANDRIFALDRVAARCSLRRGKPCPGPPLGHDARAITSSSRRATIVRRRFDAMRRTHSRAALRRNPRGNSSSGSAAKSRPRVGDR